MTDDGQQSNCSSASNLDADGRRSCGQVISFARKSNIECKPIGLELKSLLSVSVTQKIQAQLIINKEVKNKATN